MTPQPETSAAPPPFPERLSAWYEDLARHSPGRYRLELGALAILGHAYVVGVAVTLVALGVILLVFLAQGIVLAIGSGVVALRLLWTFWVKRVEPIGVTLDEEAARGILALTDEARARLQCAAPRRIVVSIDCNAAVDASSWRRNVRTLLIGFPLLMALSARELEAVLAHELGHVSRAHGRFSAWIHYVRATWEKLAQVSSWGPVAWLLNVFATWYWPRFSACSLVQARALELQADRDAVALAGADAFARGLARSIVTDARLGENLWPRIWQGAADQPDPPTDLSRQMIAELRSADPHLERRLEHAVALRTMYWDSHPSLADRIAPFHVALQTLPLVDVSAGEELLGARLPDLMRSLDALWCETAAPGWTQRHESLKQGRERVAALEAERSGSSVLSVEQEWERAAWTEELSGPDAALPLYRSLLERAPAHHAAQLALGRLLLLRKDPAGAALVEASMEDPWLVAPATALLYDHFASRGLHADADRYHRLAASHGETMEQAMRERSLFARSDDAQPHELPAEALERLRKLIDRPQVLEAYLVRKPVKLFPEKPCFVLGVRRRLRWYEMSTTAGGQKLTMELAQSVNFDEPLLFIDLDQDRAALNKIRRVPSSRILPA